MLLLQLHSRSQSTVTKLYRGVNVPACCIARLMHGWTSTDCLHHAARSISAFGVPYMHIYKPAFTDILATFCVEYNFLSFMSM